MPRSIVPNAAYPAIVQAAEQLAAERDLIAYLGILSNLPYFEAAREFQAGSFTTYLMGLSEGRFTAEEWSKAISQCFGTELQFSTVYEAQMWLYRQKIRIKPGYSV